MNLFEITAVLMVLTALFSYINYRVLHMPTTIGVMFTALAASLGIVMLSWFGVDIDQLHIAEIINKIDFNQTLLHGMLSFLLFAGAMHIKLVVFSIIVQRISLGRLVDRTYPKNCGIVSEIPI